MDAMARDLADRDSTRKLRAIGRLIAKNRQFAEPEREHHIPLFARLFIESPSRRADA